MSSRDDILKAIRRNLPQSTPLPGWEGNWIRYDDPVRQFAQILEATGGECHLVESVAEISHKLGELVAPEKTVVSCVPGVEEGRFDLGRIDDPHDLSGVDLAILPGLLGVAENGAVWVTGAGIRHRVLYFLCQHLALVLPRSAVVHNLHEAYERIEVGGDPFACFISGPSKTADIEQALVKGAHGARTLQVFLVERLVSSPEA